MSEEKIDDVRKLKCLVADSGAFLKGAELQTFSEKVFTINDVVSEIRDAATRARLAVLPYTLEFREPSSDSIKYVTEFSKKTGDYKSLSAVDIRVLALTYQLEKEFCKAEHIRQEPAEKVDASARQFNKNMPMAGFYSEKRETNKDSKEELTMDETTDDGQDGPVEMEHTSEDLQNELVTDDADSRNVGTDTTESTDTTNEKETAVEDDNMMMESDEVVPSDDSEDDDEGWICPKNIKKVKDEMGITGDMDLAETDIENACFTTDFAMQNVLIQMGLHVLSVNGMLIKQARSYVLKCYGCNKETTAMERLFCPNCGNKTLRKVAVTASADGTIQYHYARKRPVNIRGTKYSLPLPKGGRNYDGPLVVEDQKIPRNRLPKKKDIANALDPDFVARSSPFASKDVTSRAFNHGYHMRQRDWRNPNEGKKKTSRKKK